MFSKQLLGVALFAASATAQTEQMIADYPEWANMMSLLYPDYLWEAVEVETGDATTKTLFHITGSMANPSWQPGRQPVLVVGGGTTNVLTWFNTASAVYGTSKEEYAGAAETLLIQTLQSDAMSLDDQKYLRLTLETMKADLPDRWETLSKFWKDEGIVDLETVLEGLPAWGEDEADSCEVTNITDGVAEYGKAVADIGTSETYDTMTQPTKALPINLFDYGFDVWVDGNRGTIYQQQNDEWARNSAEYWDFSFREMAMEDQVAQIDYILSTERNAGVWEKLSYVGFSLGTRQMFYLMGMAPENEVARAAVNKVDKFLALTVCPWSGNSGFDPSTPEQLTARLDQYVNSGKVQTWGRGGYQDMTVDQSSDIALQCSLDHLSADDIDEETRAYYLDYCNTELGAFAPYLDALSIQEMMSEYIGIYEQGMAKTFSYEDGVWGSDLINFSNAMGPDVYMFNGLKDINCPPATIADKLLDEMPTAVKKYDYECADHVWFVDTGVQNLQLHKDMIIVLGAQALAATAAIAVTTLALF